MTKNADLPLYTISTAAHLLGISIHTLRMYEREGLIIPHKKESNQRLYSENDLERITCIRKTINQDKVSIEGIKRILSLIPCWSIIKCSQSDRDNCKAYDGHTVPCWMLNHRKNVCAHRECRECEVYRNCADCGSIKESLRTFTK